jgi:hypothetical protein
MSISFARLGSLSGAILLLTIACSSGTSGTAPLADGGSAPDGSPTAASCKAAFAASQSLSQPCCLERGPDACGAGLFCAAFDGRTQATCYPEHVRLGGQPCTADVQCLGLACDASGVCKGAPNGTCSAAIGCGKALGSDLPFFCDETASAGPICSPCTRSSTDPACAAVIPNPNLPQPGVCPKTCTTDAECQATCPKNAGASACCETASGLCFAAKAQCPRQ